MIGPRPLHSEIWVEHLGNTSCVYGVRCSSDDAAIGFARGDRTIVKFDPQTRRPAPWTDAFRQHHSKLLSATN